MRTRSVALSPAAPESRLSPTASEPESRLGPARLHGARRGLDPKSLGNLPPGDHPDGDGLVLRVTPASRTWMLRYRPKVGTRSRSQHRLRLRELGGPVGLDLAALGLSDFKGPAALTLEGSRRVATVLLGLAARGVDPLDVLKAADRRRQEREAEGAARKAEGTATLDALLDAFLKARQKNAPGLKAVRPNTLALWESLARAELRPTFGKLDPRLKQVLGSRREPQ